MQRLSLLRSIIGILFFFSMLGVIVGLPLILIVLIFPTKVPFNFNGYLLNADKMEIVFLSAVIYAAHCAFTYGLYLLKKTLALFSKRIFFDQKVIFYLGRTGKSFLISGLLWIVPLFFCYLPADNRVKTNTDADGFAIPIFHLAIGLFFTVLSEVFLMAKKMKEENELTI
ncbi:hypothetical protein CHU92_11125 [Flavobacterium cyanobacteriorum]|uniref:DUF2975 domain-containing protein n=1 Tax=Flavobacterium cyanobacteriorum TaxID=2022802 RepID=A0A255Z0Z2_9FLAO|nr:DUF2975 domain-containing protein [Flavobacterium cyanobacteriorum]OYQ35122.1 hypothetical protein CHU92_11125 [Flavobacterium cyanobacteriorum]